MEKYMGKYESKEKSRTKRRFAVRKYLLYIVIYGVVSLIGLAIMTLFGWEDSAFEHRGAEIAYAIGLLAIMAVSLMIAAISDFLKKRKSHLNKHRKAQSDPDI